MNPVIKEAWVKALESGEFKQGQGGLQVVIDHSTGEHGFCCLGVLCELYRRDHPGVEWVKSQSGTYMEMFEEGEFLPKEVQVWAGFSERYGAIFTLDEGYGDEETTLDTLNDEGRPFDEIATIIRDKL